MLIHQRRSLILLGVAVLALTGCFTGQRPALAPNFSIDDTAAEAVLDRLGGAESLDFVATYRIVPSLTGDPTQATVAQLGSRRRVTIGATEYVTDGDESQTCLNDIGDCTDFLDDARISNLNITHTFWGAAFRSRLELDASRRIGPTAGTSTTIAGQAAVCVDVVVPSVATTTGTVVYCALDAGVLARYFGADVSIELTSFSFEVSSSDFND